MSTQDKKGFTFFLQGARCFKRKAEFNIRPLTFLTGENSTGKSTVLGCMSVLGGIASFNSFASSFDFDQEPYRMGSFDDIARRVGRAESRSFCLGGTFPIGKSSATIQITATFHKIGYVTEPVMTSREYQLTYEGEEVSFKRIYERFDDPMLLERRWRSHRLYEQDVPQKFIKLLGKIYSKEIPEDVDAEREWHMAMLQSDLESNLSDDIRMHCESVGPIRAEPKRTYDLIKSRPNPQGEEIPVLLRNLQRQSGASNSDAWSKLKTGIEQFGIDAGMFKSIDVGKLGSSDSNPFQLKIQVPGKPKANLIDVGYGVSQVLPLLVRVLLQREPPRKGRLLGRQRKIFLLQQPEVHLHPQGQAALSSFFIKHIHSLPSHQFVIETHSDHMIDRARIEVQKGNIAPEDVSIIYLEHTRQEGVKAHNLKLDEMANLRGAPQGYRNFFLKETDELLGFID